MSLNVRAQNDTLNQIDDQGLKQGYWMITGKMRPEIEYSADAKIEEGRYVDGRKEGAWLKYYRDPNVLRLSGNYVNGRPDGRYVKYFENGCINEEGEYVESRLMWKLSYYPNCPGDDSLYGFPSEERYYTTKGRDTSKMFYANGQLEFIYCTVDGINIDTAYTYYPNGDLRRLMIYREDGVVGKMEHFDRMSPRVVADSYDRVTIETSDNSKKDLPQFKPNGFNIIFNDKQQLWMQGNFKDGKFNDGSSYKYDSEGILRKTIIWKNGKKQ
ncbi:hypothetical protein JYT74_00595 [Crocinitomix catalasitica]|nr:hypothetical protein [Crocinitomix catalasitica]